MLVIGGGLIGRAIQYYLLEDGIETRICDVVPKNLPNFFLLDARDEDAVKREMKKEDVVISALPYDFNHKLARIAIKAKTNFIDLGGNTEIAKKELKLNEEAKKAGIAIIPDCGLAPGMTNIVAHHMWERGARDLHIRVGGLPVNPRPPLNYALVFSIHGLINEYVEDAIIIKDGVSMEVESLTGIEKLEINGRVYEAFYTHGGISTLPVTLHGIKNLDYKTIRYEGHAEKMMLLKKLGFFEKEARKFTERILEKALPKDKKDMVIAKIYSENMEAVLLALHDSLHTAMQKTTAIPTAIMAEMVLEEGLRGAYPPELAVDSEKFIEELAKKGIKWKIS